MLGGGVFGVQGLYPFYYIDATALLSHIAVSFCGSSKVLVVLKKWHIYLNPFNSPFAIINVMNIHLFRRVRKYVWGGEYLGSKDCTHLTTLMQLPC